MNEELQKQIAEILKQAIAAAQHGNQWIAGQIPDVLQELIVWTIAHGVMMLLLFALMVVGYVYLIKALRKAEEYSDMSDFLCMASIFGGIFLFVFFWLTLSCASDAAQAIFAPKLFLLEYAKHLFT